MATSDAEILNEGERLGQLVLRKVPYLRGVSRWQVQYRLNCILFFAKALKTFRAIRVLWREGFKEDAAVLVRSMFEIYLQAAYAATDPKASVALLRDHDVFTRYSRYRDAKRIRDTVAMELFVERRGELRRLRRQSYRVRKRRPRLRKGLGWWGGNVRDLTKMLDRVSAEASREQYYVHFYADQSELVHSGPTAFKKYVREDGGRLLINAGPSTAATGDLTESVPSFATWFLCEMSAIADVAFGLGIGADVDGLKAKIADGERSVGRGK